MGNLQIFSEGQALDFIARRIRNGGRGTWERAPRRSKQDEARELLAHVLLAHVPEVIRQADGSAAALVLCTIAGAAALAALPGAPGMGLPGSEL